MWLLGALVGLVTFLSLTHGYPFSPTLQSRDTWNGDPLRYGDALAKGKELRCAMTLSTRLAATCFKGHAKTIPSQFDRYSQLREYGWARRDNDLGRMGNMQGSLDWRFRQLGLLGSPPGSDRHTVYVEQAHTHEYTRGNQLMQPTEAFYGNIYNVVEGVLIADELESPIYARRRCPGTVIPDLNRWSDVTFLEYEKLCNDEPEESARLDELYDEDEEEKFEEETRFWDKYRSLRRTYGWSTDEFAALIGAPNGRISAWLLIQHKEKWKNKRIAQVEVFVQHVKDRNNPDGLTRPGMMMTVVDSE
ncbi:hypothetical protein N7492_004860 [Penicillium capsulatum]|uniref:Uncharacterized protein n=1 Tax=Penicillium capsulatum TaxID=69766 RepID=A0A9W9ICC8_9EURO|nr:hypothetical protein N7492_004860 [Penicillium capsulatum]KAJ6136031.1 hypothetical protein N7512_001191 [Penicillium capsulatum]